MGIAEQRLAHNPKLLTTFSKCLRSTIDTTTKRMENGETFVFTGDIPAMWLRDSSAQVVHYLPFIDDEPELADIIKGLLRRQYRCICTDSYANAFNEEANNNRDWFDATPLHKMVWERKYEVDSLCYPIWLTYKYFKQTGDMSILDGGFLAACHTIVETFVTEQHHMRDSLYNFQRDISLLGFIETETLQNDGRGMPVNYTGMTWSGFRPSDDACTFGYLVPSNMFAVVILGYMCEMLTALGETNLTKKAAKLRHEIDYGIRKYAIYHHPKFGDIYAYETDGFGNYTLMDDANVPSLLSIPYLGYTDIDNPIYQNTRAFVLSKENPYYYEGTCAKGIGSPHTPPEYIWHIALSMQGLTAKDPDEAKRLIDLILSTDADCNVMHEGFNVNDPHQFTRPWFAWANSLFAELVYKTYLKD